MDLSRVTISDSLTSAQIGAPLSFDIHHGTLDELEAMPMPLDVAITGKIIRIRFDHHWLPIQSSIRSSSVSYAHAIERKYYTY
jgi:hypothetical protein